VVAIVTLARLVGVWTRSTDLPTLRPRTAARPTGTPAAAMDEFVTVATYENSALAHIALGRLAAEGIKAVLFDENLVQMSWGYSIAVGGIKLRVTYGNAAAARKVLETDYSTALNDVDVGEPEA